MEFYIFLWFKGKNKEFYSEKNNNYITLEFFKKNDDQ